MLPLSTRWEKEGKGLFKSKNVVGLRVTWQFGEKNLLDEFPRPQNTCWWWEIAPTFLFSFFSFLEACMLFGWDSQVPPSRSHETHVTKSQQTLKTLTCRPISFFSEDTAFLEILLLNENRGNIFQLVFFALSACMMLHVSDYPQRLWHWRKFSTWNPPKHWIQHWIETICSMAKMWLF